jgi:aspartyl-tRNA(Asn)/glutamyl-tRNA(Gln) amidotransferase subunit C
MKLTSDEVKHIAKLARLKLSEDEINKFGDQLSGILTNAKTLDEVDTSNVEPIAQITGLRNVTFEDKEEPCALADKLLEQSPQQIQDHMIKVKSVF